MKELTVIPMKSVMKIEKLFNVIRNPDTLPKNSYLLSDSSKCENKMFFSIAFERAAIVL